MSDIRPDLRDAFNGTDLVQKHLALGKAFDQITALSRQVRELKAQLKYAAGVLEDADRFGAAYIIRAAIKGEE